MNEKSWKKIRTNLDIGDAVKYKRGDEVRLIRPIGNISTRCKGIIKEIWGNIIGQRVYPRLGGLYSVRFGKDRLVKCMGFELEFF